MKKLFTTILITMLTFTASTFAYADEVTVCPEESPAATIAAAQAAVNMKNIKPELKAASHSYNKIKLSWDAVSGASGYEVYRATSKTGKFQKVAAIAAEKTSYINTGLTCGKTYWYKLRAYKIKSGKKVYSKYSDVKSTYPKPSKVKGVNADYDISNWGIQWSKVSGATGYQLQYNRSGEGWKYYWKAPSYNGGWINIYAQGYDGKKLLDNGTKKYLKTTQAVWDLGDEGSSMSFRVRAYRMVNGKKVFGLYSEPTTIKPVWNSGKELQDFVHTWVDENYPSYDRAFEEAGYANLTPEEGTSWGTTWTWQTISQYDSKEYVLDIFCEGVLKSYFGAWWGLAEETRGILYTRDLGDGTYQVWWLG